GEAGLGQFVKDYNTVLDKLSATTPRIVILSPHRHEDLGGAWPNPEEHNRNLKLYVEAVRKIATERHLVFVDLFEKLAVSDKQPITSNGIHLSNRGYAKATSVIAKELGLTVAEKEFTRADAL